MNFLGMGPAELIVVLIIAVIVLGPGKLPEVARALGKTVREFRTLTDGFQNELRRELNEASSTVKDDIKPLQDVATTISSVKSLDPVGSISASVKEEMKPLQEVADTISPVKNLNPEASILSGDSLKKEKTGLAEATTVSKQKPDDSFTAHYQETQGATSAAQGDMPSTTDSVDQDDHPVAFQQRAQGAGEEEDVD